MAYWIFKCNPAYYDLEGRLLDPQSRLTWTVPTHRKLIAVDDVVFVWLTGLQGGIRAVLRVVQSPSLRARLRSEQSFCSEFDAAKRWRLEAAFTHRSVHIPPHELRADRVLRYLSVFRGFQQATVFRVTDSQGRRLEELVQSRGSKLANMFTLYKQEENQFTNGLVSVLAVARRDRPSLLRRFLREIIPTGPLPSIDSLRVLQGYGSTADGELSGQHCCIHIETKINSGSLERDQVLRHLRNLRRRSHRRQRLVLLTPDDSKSEYTRRFLRLDSCVCHMEWRELYDLLRVRWSSGSPGAMDEMIRQYLHRIRDVVFAYDVIGVIQKISFGDHSGVYADTYLKEFARRQWPYWHTPRLYPGLDGTGRKLFLYDPTRKAITALGEIRDVRKLPGRRAFPFRNTFVPGTLSALPRPIALERIRLVDGFESFGRDRTAYRNVTHEQLHQLMALQDTSA